VTARPDIRLENVRRRISRTTSLLASDRSLAQDKGDGPYALRSAVLLTDEHGAIVHGNRAAGHLLRDSGPISKGQRYSASDNSINRI
jgi:hypothetical protein